MNCYWVVKILQIYYFFFIWGKNINFAKKNKPQLRFFWVLIMKRLYIGILILFGIIVVLQLAIPPIRILVYKGRNPHTTAYMEVMRKDMIKKTGTDSLFRHQFVPIHKISPSLVHAVNCAEDRGRFFYHHGLVASHIIYAIRKHESGYPLHGGSCITQQTAKNIFLTHRRSYVRKIKELYYAILMENIWGKFALWNVI